MTSISPDIIRDLAPIGRLRSTINLGNIVLAHQNPNGELGGVSVELARELARRVGVEAELHPFDTAGRAFAALASGACDIGFLAFDPKRGEELDYTAPYLIIEGTVRRAGIIAAARGGRCRPGRRPDRGGEKYGLRSASLPRPAPRAAGALSVVGRCHRCFSGWGDRRGCGRAAAAPGSRVPA